MARQKELPGTRRDDEKAPPQNDDMDDLCAAIGKNKRKRTRANQDVVGATKAALDKMAELGFQEYEYEFDGVKRKLVRDSKLKDVKTKVIKRRPDDEDDEEGGE